MAQRTKFSFSSKVFEGFQIIYSFYQKAEQNGDASDLHSKRIQS
jgi:hypothetical protein